MKTITYNPETHVLVPREPNHNWCAGCSPDNCSGCGDGPVACDLVPTTVECIKKLKEENESLKLDAERWRMLSALMFLGNVECTQDADGGYRIELDPAENMLGVSWEGNSPEEAIDAAMAKEEQG